MERKRSREIAKKGKKKRGGEKKRGNMNQIFNGHGNKWNLNESFSEYLQQGKKQTIFKAYLKVLEHKKNK